MAILYIYECIIYYCSNNLTQKLKIKTKNSSNTFKTVLVSFVVLVTQVLHPLQKQHKLKNHGLKYYRVCV